MIRKFFSPLTAKQRAYRDGVMAEKIAMVMLALKGYRILSSRYRNPFGEIDIVAKRQNYVVFVEVKHRRDRTTFSYSISPKQQQRITRAAQYFLTHYDPRGRYIGRFDCVFVGNRFLPSHTKNIIPSVIG